jgi:hypothetical protein
MNGRAGIEWYIVHHPYSFPFVLVLGAVEEGRVKPGVHQENPPFRICHNFAKLAQPVQANLSDVKRHK